MWALEQNKTNKRIRKRTNWEDGDNDRAGILLHLGNERTILHNVPKRHTQTFPSDVQYSDHDKVDENGAKEASESRTLVLRQ
jgi:hypothetical protein